MFIENIIQILSLSKCEAIGILFAKTFYNIMNFSALISDFLTDLQCHGSTDLEKVRAKCVRRPWA
jgi:hypothetical protein